MNRRTFLAVSGLGLTLALAGGAALAQIRIEGGDNDKMTTDFDVVRKRLEEEGYSNVVQEDAYRRDQPWMKALATTPEGERVRILFDNLGNRISERPLGAN